MRFILFIAFCGLLASCIPRDYDCNLDRKENKKFTQIPTFLNENLRKEVQKVYLNANSFVYQTLDGIDTFKVDNYVISAEGNPNKEGKNCLYDEGDSFYLNGKKIQFKFEVLASSICITYDVYGDCFKFNNDNVNFQKNIVKNRTIENSILYVNETDTLCFQKDSGFVYFKINPNEYTKK